MRIERLAAVPQPDRTPLLDAWVRAWTPLVPAIDFEARRGWLSEHLDELLGRGAMLLLVRDPAGQAVGFLTLDPQTGEIDQLAVDPAVAGRGLGRALMDEAKRLSPHRLALRVNTLNGRAIAFYGSAGFVTTGTTVSAKSGLPVLTMAWPGSA